MGISTHKKWISTVTLVGVALVVVLGAVIFRARFYAWITLAVAVLSCLPMLFLFEKSKMRVGELMLLAVWVALTVVGRMVFAWVPAFKPVSALIIIAALCLGREVGFFVGTLSAVLSNFYFGQGPWTPFQMLVWGTIGFLAGCFAVRLQKNKWLLSLFGIGAAILFSAVMDVWTVLWADGTVMLSRYLAATLTAIPTTVSYAASNVIFLLLFARPLVGMLGRIRTKYGLFSAKE